MLSFSFINIQFFNIFKLELVFSKLIEICLKTDGELKLTSKK